LVGRAVFHFHDEARSVIGKVFAVGKQDCPRPFRLHDKLVSSFLNTFMTFILRWLFQAAEAPENKPAHPFMS
ncbi:hypothetical protein, partial [Pseudomonas syringae]|uniref:hypothetical protein n=1 Tax=Pseudomonas syringae TaxID=317 RepID=UPI001F2E38EF